MEMQHQQPKAMEEHQSIPQDILAEALELARGAEILPEGPLGLAKRIYSNRRAGKPLRVKLGVDPTSTDLHVGHAVPLRKLRRFQEFGHQVVLIIGGFTAQIGDPSGRNATRPQLTPEQVKTNATTYLQQVDSILDLSKTEIVNNSDWLAQMTLSDVLALASKVTANQLLAKEAFGDRLEQQLPIGFHELFYPLLQGYDSIAICSDIELGGTDQRFNILQGRELQPSYGQNPQLGMFLPLLEGTDGKKKMSKTYGNYIALKDPPIEMFGKCMSIPDPLILKYFELATTLSGQEIDDVKLQLEQGGNPKEAKTLLARQIVGQYHGPGAAEHACEEWDRVHSQKCAPEQMSSHSVSVPIPLFRLLHESGLTKSTGEAKRLILEGGVRLDGEQMKDPLLQISLPPGESKVLQVGRRKFVRLEPA